MELQFQKVGGRYEAEFEATGDFNLHCERKGAGNFKLYQKGTPEGQYATESSYADHNAEAVVDKDFSMLVYPKHIKVVSEKEVTYCVATISGGGISDNVGRFVPYVGPVEFFTSQNDQIIEFDTDSDGVVEIPKEQIVTYGQVFACIPDDDVLVKHANIGEATFKYKGFDIRVSSQEMGFNYKTIILVTVSSEDEDLGGSQTDYYGTIKLTLYKIA